MSELERATGDCGNCPIAVNFDAGGFEQTDLEECKFCQENTPPRHKSLLQEINATAAERRRQEQDTTQVFTDRFGNSH